MNATIARAILLTEIDYEDGIHKWFSTLGFTNTHYRKKPYDKVARTDIDVFHKANPYKSKYNVVSIDFDNKHALLWDHGAGKYKKLKFSDLRLHGDGSIVSHED